MSEIIWLSDDPEAFPNTQLALNEPNGLVAAGGDLSIARLLAAYKRGIFPWYAEQHDPILWWSPNPRCVLYPADVHISKSLKRQLKKNAFTYTFNTCFSSVIHACRAPRKINQKIETGTWINDDMLHAYEQLHQQGAAHSIEVWENNELVGGIYGVAIGTTFFGESMFSTRSNASKCALTQLCLHLNSWGFTLLDCQVHSKHLTSMGAVEIPRSRFEKLIYQNKCHFPHLMAWNFNSLLLEACLKK